MSLESHDYREGEKKKIKESGGEYRELTDREGEEKAREKLSEIHKTEAEIDRAVSGLPDTPETRELQKNLASQRTKIHEAGRDIGNGTSMHSPEQLQQALLVFPEILSKIISLLKDMFSSPTGGDKEKNQISDVGQIHTDTPVTDMPEDITDSPRDENGYIVTEVLDSTRSILSAVISGVSHKFLQDREQGFLTSQNDENLELKDALISQGDVYYIPFDNSHGFFKTDVVHLHVEVGGSFFTDATNGYESYLHRFAPDLAHIFTEHKHEPGWIAQKNFSVLPYMSLCGAAFLDCEDGGGDVSRSILSQLLQDLQDAYPDMFPIEREQFADASAVENNYEVLKKQFHMSIQKSF